MALSGIPASAALNERSGLNVSGRGATKAKREVNVRLYTTLWDSNPALTPTRMHDVVVRSRALKFNSRARGLKKCGARLPTNGAAARCPSRSKVGTGKFRAILGFPGAPANSLGDLSDSRGSIRVYNYKHSRSQQARLLVVITASTPVNYTINMFVPVTRSGTATIVMPDMTDVVPAVRNLFPAGTRIVPTRFDVTLKAKRQRRGKPFMYLNTLRHLDLKVRRNME